MRCAFIFADIMVLLGRDPYHAACTEKFMLVFALAPLVALAPYLLYRWDEYQRREKARRRAARRRKLERMGR